MPRLQNLEPVWAALSETVPSLSDDEEFADAFRQLAKSKPNGLVLGNREGVTTARTIAQILNGVCDDELQQTLFTMIHNNGEQECIIGSGAKLIKSPCFTCDFAQFHQKEGVFADFDSQLAELRIAADVQSETPRHVPRTEQTDPGLVTSGAVLVESGEAMIVTSGEAGASGKRGSNDGHQWGGRDRREQRSHDHERLSTILL